MPSLLELAESLHPIHSFFNNTNVDIISVIKPNKDNRKHEVIFWVSPQNSETLEEYQYGTIICNKIPSNCANTFCNYLVFENPRLAFMELLKKYFTEKVEYKIAPSAVIHSSVNLNPKISIGENVVIEKNCSLGENVLIGHNTIIHSGTSIGDNVIIGCNNTIGSIGFGYERDKEGKLQLINHIGGVNIKNNVEIGNNTCIDRAVLENTVIGEGTKIDNLVHIAHNVIIGKNAVIIAHAMIGGSTIIGDNAWIAPSTSLRDGLVIGEGSQIGIGAVVVKNVPSKEIWIGNPAKQHVK